jgi:hypothetical protein
MASKITLELSNVKFTAKDLAVSEPSVAVIANNLYQKVLDGKASAVETFEAVTFAGKVAESLKGCVDENGKNKFVDLVRQEITDNLQGEKAYVTKFGSSFSLAEVGTKYDFKSSGDPIWDSLEAEATRIDKLKKDREKFLKTIQDLVIMSFPDPTTGELLENVEIKAPVKTSTSSFKTELRKL